MESHGKSLNLENHFPGLEKSWNFTKMSKVMEKSWNFITFTKNVQKIIVIKTRFVNYLGSCKTNVYTFQSN